QLLEFAIEHQRFFLAHAFGHAVGKLYFHFFQALDRAFDRLEVGHHAAQPTAVYEGHAATSGFSRNEFASCTLGANKKDVAATRCNLTHEFGRLLVFDNGLLKVDDVNFVTAAKDERSHLGVPVTGLVAKVHTGFQHFTH